MHVESVGTASSRDNTIEVSVVMPCLNEAETLETCIQKALRCLSEHQVQGEVIIADNGSTDGSIQIALRAGARVVHVREKGYGSAIMGGFREARGRYLLMGDADDSYDFTDLMPFIDKLREGCDLVMGNRFRGGIKPGAMPWHHKYIGNPALTAVLRLFFRPGIGDAHCGLRALTKEAFEAMRLRTTGMEFASEMVVKAAASGMRIAEVPTILSPDGRSRPPHLRSFHDGWRHLRFLMLLKPMWTLVAPGVVMMLVGLVLSAVLWSGPIRLGQTVLDIHTMILSLMLFVIGYQAASIGIAARIFAVHNEIGPHATLGVGVWNWSLERGLVVGVAMLAVGGVLCGSVVLLWAKGSFGPLDTNETLRALVTGATMIGLGVQTILISFFYSMLSLDRRRWVDNPDDLVHQKAA